MRWRDEVNTKRADSDASSGLFSWECDKFNSGQARHVMKCLQIKHEQGAQKRVAEASRD
jgi:hypothetical protein